MGAEEQPSINAAQSVPLKLDEPQIDPEDPWGDDLLSRQDIVARLTDLVATQEPPLTISIHGEWGTGKTFLLTRWQKALETFEYEAIYFNAWEDDYCDNPLLAIVGQLSGHFKELGLKRLARKAAKVAVPLIMEGLTVAVKTTTALPLSLDLQRQGKKTLLDAYQEQGAAKNQLKAQLANLSKKVAERTGHPLIFIIDELDRCRPTFAIELLERVKHIFDVPNMVFVFGINRDELCKSLKSIYGEIDADVYLRRFFDMEFNLPKVGSEGFARQKMRDYALESLRPIDHIPGQPIEIDVLIEDMPMLWSHLELSLRDIDYCVRLIALVGSSLEPRQTMLPWMLGLLIALKLKTPALYDEFLTGNRRGCDVMNYLNKKIPILNDFSPLTEILIRLEANLYLSDKRFGTSEKGIGQALAQLKLLQSGSALTTPDHLAQRTRSASRYRIDRLIEMIERYESYFHYFPRSTVATDGIGYVASLINLNQNFARR